MYHRRWFGVAHAHVRSTNSWTCAVHLSPCLWTLTRRRRYRQQSLNVSVFTTLLLRSRVRINNHHTLYSPVLRCGTLYHILSVVPTIDFSYGKEPYNGGPRVKCACNRLYSPGLSIGTSLQSVSSNTVMMVGYLLATFDTV